MQKQLVIMLGFSLAAANVAAYSSPRRQSFGQPTRKTFNTADTQNSEEKKPKITIVSKEECLPAPQENTEHITILIKDQLSWNRSSESDFHIPIPCTNYQLNIIQTFHLLAALKASFGAIPAVYEFAPTTSVDENCPHYQSWAKKSFAEKIHMPRSIEDIWDIAQLLFCTYRYLAGSDKLLINKRPEATQKTE